MGPAFVVYCVYIAFHTLSTCTVLFNMHTRRLKQCVVVHAESPAYVGPPLTPPVHTCTYSCVCIHVRMNVLVYGVLSLWSLCSPPARADYNVCMYIVHVYLYEVNMFSVPSTPIHMNMYMYMYIDISVYTLMECSTKSCTVHECTCILALSRHVCIFHTSPLPHPVLSAIVSQSKACSSPPHVYSSAVARWPRWADPSTEQLFW